MIIKTKSGKYQVKSHDGKKNLGTYSSMAAARKRLAQVEMFKSMDKGAKKRGMMNS